MEGAREEVEAAIEGSREQGLDRLHHGLVVFPVFHLDAMHDDPERVQNMKMIEVSRGAGGRHSCLVEG